MRSFWGGLLLSSVAAIAVSRAGRFDGAADLLDDTGTGDGTGTGTGDGTGTGTGDGTGTGTGDGTGTGTGDGTGTGTVPDWAKVLSAEKNGEDPSNQEWVAKLGVKDLDGLAKIARDNQKALRESGRVKIPGENATDEEKAAFREAMGAPKEAAGYEVAMPEGAEQYELDTAVIDPLREIAHKHGVPAAAFKELADVFMAKALEDAKGEVVRTDAEAAEKVKEWGANATQRKEEFRRGARLLELTKADVASIQREFGAGKTLELFAKIGQLAGEDFFAGNDGDPARKFGIASLEAAQKAVDSYVNDKEKADKIRAGDKAMIEGYNRSVEALAAWRQRDSQKR